MNRIVLFDGHNLAYIAFHTAKNIARRSDTFDAEYLKRMIYHIFFNKFFSLLKILQGDSYILVWDSKNSTQWRKSQHTDYKSTRIVDEKTKILFSAIDNLIELFHNFPIQQFYYNNFEADDILYKIISETKNYETIIVSNDGDMQQIAQQFNTIIYNPHKKKYVDDVPTDYDICVYKALVGDGSDNIPGIKGIGIKNGQRIARELYNKELTKENLSKYLKEDDIDTFQSYFNIIDIKSNPHLNQLNIEYKDVSLHQDEIIKFFKKYEMKSQLTSWEKNKKLLKHI